RGSTSSTLATARGTDPASHTVHAIANRSKKKKGDSRPDKISSEKEVCYVQKTTRHTSRNIHRYARSGVRIRRGAVRRLAAKSNWRRRSAPDLERLRGQARDY